MNFPTEIDAKNTRAEFISGKVFISRETKSNTIPCVSSKQVKVKDSSNENQ